MGAVAALVVLAIGSNAGAATGPDRTVVLAIAPVVNAWRTAMLDSWGRATGAAIRNGDVAAAPVHTAARNTLAAEATQLAALIDQHPAAIVIDAGSPTGLNPLVRRACDAGIVVVSFDGIVTEPCAYRLQFDFRKLGTIEVEALSERLPEGGNVLEMRGLGGTDLDQAVHDGVAAAIAGQTTLRIVAAVHGNWRRGEAMHNTASVLPVLPKIDGVITQGGDALGVADAFAAAGRPMPVIILGNRAEELGWWKQQRDTVGYQTLSVAPGSGIASLAFWIAQMVLDGADVPHDVRAPLLEVAPPALDTALNSTAGGYYSRDYTRADAEQAVTASRP
jgi:ribose transport system substrate-binding protein